MTAYWLAQWRGCHRLSDWYHNIFSIVTNVASKSSFRSIAPLLAYIFFFWAPIPLVPVPSLMPFVH